MYIKHFCEADRLLFGSYQSRILLLQGHASDPPLEDDKETSKLAHTLYSLYLSYAADCGGLAGWHHRDPVAPCGNQRQPVMKDDGRLFPVIETLLMGGDGELGAGSNRKRKRERKKRKTVEGERYCGGVLWPTSDVMEHLKTSANCDICLRY
ncbi:hypothetical protein F2P81_016090 [Scophthalmus maximus]|uniref:Uncharacterized protein n=1 Tax=Scophthalmus maximus TaxID=52904 RepID=A0A6A4SG07_SCOMX|nr:hypothetical protein F2P81_016090 [Scophthalmus maximus]